jgi:hypothetical protein
MASDPIETAPKNEEWIALLSESGDVFEIARWSVEKGNWVGREGEPIQINPTHWFRPDPSWLSAIYTSPQNKKAPRRKLFGLYAGLLIIAWSAMLEVPWFVGLPIRENLVKFFSTDASIAHQPVASEPVAGTDMANLYARTAAESPAGTENTYAQESPKPSSSTAKQGPEQLHVRADALVGDPAIDALARDLAALREDIEAIKTRVAAASPARIEAAQSVQRAAASPPPAPLLSPAESSVRRGNGGALPTGEPEVAAPDDGISVAVPPVSAIDGEPIALFMRRGGDFIAAGDFVGARVMFRQAAELGDARAALILAGTYDPNPLERFPVNGVTADFAKAPFWYETAMLSALPIRREGSNPWPPGQWPKAGGLDGS